jgi:hypothetical protein
MIHNPTAADQVAVAIAALRAAIWHKPFPPECYAGDMTPLDEIIPQRLAIALTPQVCVALCAAGLIQDGHLHADVLRYIGKPPPEVQRFHSTLRKRKSQ